MSCKYTLHHESMELPIEDFGDAILCNGRVFLRETLRHHVNTAPNQCWGDYIDVPTGAFVDGERCERAMQLCIDDVGQSYTVTIVESLSPLSISTSLHIGVEYCAEEESEKSPSPLTFKVENGRALVSDFPEHLKTLLIPAKYQDFPVFRVDLRECSMENVETLIISEGVEELALDFFDAYKLKRFIIPEGVKLLCPLDGISSTPWFCSRKREPIIIGGCYCGTPGGGSGGVRSLILPEGVESIAGCADFHCYWHSIKTPGSLRSIGRLAFATCHCLEELNLSEGLERIEIGAFCECKRLKRLYLPSSLQSLEQLCFQKAMFIQEVSVAKESFAEVFPEHRVFLRSDEGEELLHDAPPIVIPLTDRISACPGGSNFTAAGRTYKSLSELCASRLDWETYSYLDIHGRQSWLIAAYDDGIMGIVERRYLREGDVVTQIELCLDGTVLVREGIGILDVPHALRNIAAMVVFQFENE